MDVSRETRLTVYEVCDLMPVIRQRIADTLWGKFYIFLDGVVFETINSGNQAKGGFRLRCLKQPKQYKYTATSRGEHYLYLSNMSTVQLNQWKAEANQFVLEYFAL